MYGENGERLRAVLGDLLRQHRIQSRIGGPLSDARPATTTPKERQQVGEQIRRYRQSVLVWSLQATTAMAPGATSTLTKAPSNPFRSAIPSHGSLAALHLALEHSVRASTAPLPTMEELTSPHATALVEQWRQAARAAALGEHDFAAGLGHGRLDAQQRQTVIGDVAAVVRGLVVLDERYDKIPGWEKLSRSERLGWSALACALDSSLDPPDYSVDLRGWQPPTKVINGPAKPGLLGVLQAEHNLVIRMRTFPNALNLRLVVDSQRLLSATVARLAQPIEPALHHRWAAREQTYAALQQELRNIEGIVGHGGLATAEGANALGRAKVIPAGTDLNSRALHGLDQLFNRLDTRLADIVEDGVTRSAYVARVKLPQLGDQSSQLIHRPAEHHVTLADGHSTLIELTRTRLRPIPEKPQTRPGAARSRADLHAALVHQPERREGGLAL